MALALGPALALGSAAVLEPALALGLALASEPALALESALVFVQDVPLTAVSVQDLSSAAASASTDRDRG